jgi:NitT/TauT family transport system ATP-binding protein
MIEVKNVWKEYGDQVVLERISLAIEPRAFVALVGPSGCGKTTFLKLLLGEERPTQGTITLDGKPLSPEPGPDRGVVFQRYSVFPHLTVLGNVLLGKEFQARKFTARLTGTARRAAIEQSRALIAEVGLAASEDKYPAQLSGGMQQRLALAQALIMRPRVLLLDEPFGALDPGIRADIHVLMRRLWNETDLTVVMVTHDMREAFTLATRVIAFERPRSAGDTPFADRERYGANLGSDIQVWPRRVAGGFDPDAPVSSPDRDDPIAATGPRRDDPAPIPKGASQ